MNQLLRRLTRLDTLDNVDRCCSRGPCYQEDTSLGVSMDCDDGSCLHTLASVVMDNTTQSMHIRFVADGPDGGYHTFQIA